MSPSRRRVFAAALSLAVAGGSAGAFVEAANAHPATRVRCVRTSAPVTSTHSIVVHPLRARRGTVVRASTAPISVVHATRAGRRIHVIRVTRADRRIRVVRVTHAMPHAVARVNHTTRAMRAPAAAHGRITAVRTVRCAGVTRAHR